MPWSQCLTQINKPGVACNSPDQAGPIRCLGLLHRCPGSCLLAQQAAADPVPAPLKQKIMGLWNGKLKQVSSSATKPEQISFLHNLQTHTAVRYAWSVVRGVCLQLWQEWQQNPFACHISPKGRTSSIKIAPGCSAAHPGARSLVSLCLGPTACLKSGKVWKTGSA